MDQSAFGVLKKNSKNFQLDFKIYVPQQRKFLVALNSEPIFKWRPQLWLRSFWRRGRAERKETRQET
jgi:hypothetical protein